MRGGRLGDRPFEQMMTPLSTEQQLVGGVDSQRGSLDQVVGRQSKVGVPRSNSVGNAVGDTDSMTAIVRGAIFVQR